MNFPVLSETGCKGMRIFLIRKIILKNFQKF